MNSEVFGIILGRIVLIIVCGVIGKNRKMGAGLGALLGFLLGVIGLIIVACSSKKISS